MTSRFNKLRKKKPYLYRLIQNKSFHYLLDGFRGAVTIHVLLILIPTKKCDLADGRMLGKVISMDRWCDFSLRNMQVVEALMKPTSITLPARITHFCKTE